MTEIRDVYSRITGKIIADLEQGIRPWHKSWSADHAAGRITHRDTGHMRRRSSAVGRSSSVPAAPLSHASRSGRNSIGPTISPGLAPGRPTAAGQPRWLVRRRSAAPRPGLLL
jgi:hypothetical protein